MSRVNCMELFPYQKKHLLQMKKCLEENNFAFDFSTLGSGKTYVSAKLSQDYDYTIYIGPKSVLNKWTTITGAQKDFVLSWAKLRSENLFIKKSGKNFSKTKFYSDLISQNKKILIVADEIQNAKNKSNQNKALRELLKPILKNKIHFIGISGSPFDKKEHVLRMLETCWFTEGNSIVEWSKELKIHSFRGYYILCEKLNIPLTIPIASKIVEKVYSLFLEFFKPKYCFEMEYFESPGIECRNVFISEKEKLKKTLEKFYVMVKDGNYITNLSTILHQIEKLKMAQIYKMVDEAIAANRKIVVLLNYLENIFDFQKKYNCLCITGSNSIKERTEILSRFQEPNNEMLVGNLSVLSTGIDLDDKVGDRKRIVFANPNYSAITCFQMTKRFKRMDTKSLAEINFIYFGNEDSIEKKIMDCLVKKSKIMAEITTFQTQCGEKYLEFENCKIKPRNNVECGVCFEKLSDKVYTCQFCNNKIDYSCHLKWKKNCIYCRQ